MVNTSSYLQQNVCAEVRPVVVLTGHVHHPAVAVLHDVPCFTVNPAGGNTVDLEKARLQSLWLALSPRGRQVGQLQVRKEVWVKFKDHTHTLKIRKPIGTTKPTIINTYFVVLHNWFRYNSLKTACCMHNWLSHQKQNECCYAWQARKRLSGTF